MKAAGTIIRPMYLARGACVCWEASELGDSTQHTEVAKRLGFSPGNAATISIGAVVREVEPLIPAECFAPGYDGRCPLFPRCPLRGALHAAQSAFLRALDAYTLMDMMGSQPGLPQAPR